MKKNIVFCVFIYSKLLREMRGCQNVLHWHMTNNVTMTWCCSYLWTKNNFPLFFLCKISVDDFYCYTHIPGHIFRAVQCVCLCCDPTHYFWIKQLLGWCFVPCPCLGEHARGKLTEAWNMCLAVVIEISLTTTDQWEQPCLPLPTFWSKTGVWGTFVVNSET